MRIASVFMLAAPSFTFIPYISNERTNPARHDSGVFWRRELWNIRGFCIRAAGGAVYYLDEQYRNRYRTAVSQRGGSTGGAHALERVASNRECVMVCKAGEIGLHLTILGLIPGARRCWGSFLFFLGTMSGTTDSPRHSAFTLGGCIARWGQRHHRDGPRINYGMKGGSSCHERPRRANWSNLIRATSGMWDVRRRANLQPPKMT